MTLRCPGCTARRRTKGRRKRPRSSERRFIPQVSTRNRFAIPRGILLAGARSRERRGDRSQKSRQGGGPPLRLAGRRYEMRRGRAKVVRGKRARFFFGTATVLAAGEDAQR